jgi:hypothetical protein
MMKLDEELRIYSFSLPLLRAPRGVKSYLRHFRSHPVASARLSTKLLTINFSEHVDMLCTLCLRPIVCDHTLSLAAKKKWNKLVPSESYFMDDTILGVSSVTRGCAWSVR